MVRDRQAMTIAGPRSWYISLEEDVDDFRRFDRVLIEVLALMDSLDITDDDQLLGAVRLDPDQDWLVSACRIREVSVREGPPTAFLSPPGSFAAYSGDVISGPLAEALAGAHCARKISKLLAQETDERHLFLVALESGIGSPAWFGLSDCELEHLPLQDPQLPDGVSHLWLSAGTSGGLMMWSRHEGWRIVQFDVREAAVATVSGQKIARPAGRS